MNSYAMKMFLLCSHAIFLIPLIYLVTRKSWHTLIHCVLLFVVMMTSLFYHFCVFPIPQENIELHFCVMRFSSLYILDFQMLALTAINLLTYQLDVQISNIRELIILLTLVAIYGILQTYNNTYFSSFLCVECFFIILTRGYSRKIKACYKKWWLPMEGNWKLALYSLICLTLGFICFGLHVEDDLYYIIHGFWHISSALGLFFGFCWLDSFNHPTCIATPIFDPMYMLSNNDLCVQLITGHAIQKKSPPPNLVLKINCIS